VVILVDRNWISGVCQWRNVVKKNQSSYLTVRFNGYKETNDFLNAKAGFGKKFNMSDG
jgi:hypothetical protein